jgi:pilus assembly protein CpaB
MRRLTPGTVTIGVLAILIGLAAAYAARRYMAVPPQVAEPAPRTPVAEVVVATINLPQYSRLRDQDLKVVSIPRDRVPKGAMTSKSQALFRLVKSTIMAEQPVMDANLYGLNEVPKLSDIVPPGYRAVTLPVSFENALNGMIQPDSIVDVNLTVTDKNPQMNGPTTLTLMRDVKVLVTSDLRFPLHDDRTGNVRNITVAVTPDQANKLILAQRYGTLSVTLCGSADGKAEPTLAEDEDRNLVDRDTLLGLSPLPEPVEPVVVQRTVEVWHGGAKKEVVFYEGEILESINATAVAEGRPPMKTLPVSADQPNQGAQGGAKKPCKNCGKKKAAEAAKKAAEAAKAQEALKAAEDAARQAVPGRPISNAQPTPAPAAPASDKSGANPKAGGRSQVAGQVIEVQVEAEQSAPAK